MLPLRLVSWRSLGAWKRALVGGAWFGEGVLVRVILLVWSYSMCVLNTHMLHLLTVSRTIADHHLAQLFHSHSQSQHWQHSVLVGCWCCCWCSGVLCGSTPVPSTNAWWVRASARHASTRQAPSRLVRVSRLVHPRHEVPDYYCEY